MYLVIHHCCFLLRNIDYYLRVSQLFAKIYICHRGNGGENICGQHPRIGQTSHATQCIGQRRPRRRSAAEHWSTGTPNDSEVAEIAVATSSIWPFRTTCFCKLLSYHTNITHYYALTFYIIVHVNVIHM